MERMKPLPIASQQAMPSSLGEDFPGYPRAVREIHQIEITSICNLRCVYCPHPKMPRPKLHMEWSTFEQALKHVAHFVEAGTQTELALTGIGEPTLHPDFVRFVEAAREAIGYGRPLTFATNGIKLTEDLCSKIQRYNPRIFISMHRPERAGPAAVIAQKFGLLAGINNSFVTSAFDWGGQVKWHVNAPEVTCEFLRAGWGVILADGRVTTCCLDAEPVGVIGHVSDAPGTMVMRPFKLCDGCHMKVPEAVRLVA